MGGWHIKLKMLFIPGRALAHPCGTAVSEGAALRGDGDADGPAGERERMRERSIT